MNTINHRRWLPTRLGHHLSLLQSMSLSLPLPGCEDNAHNMRTARQSRTDACAPETIPGFEQKSKRNQFQTNTHNSGFITSVLDKNTVPRFTHHATHTKRARLLLHMSHQHTTTGSKKQHLTKADPKASEHAQISSPQETETILYARDIFLYIEETIQLSLDEKKGLRFNPSRRFSFIYRV